MDIRIKKTKNSIINAFLELRAQKSIEKITVKELCEKAMVNKSTFYSHFSDLYALSEYLEIQLTNEILEEIEHPETLFSQPEEFNKQLIYAFLSHERLIQTLLFRQPLPFLSSLPGKRAEGNPLWAQTRISKRRGCQRGADLRRLRRFLRAPEAPPF